MFTPTYSTIRTKKDVVYIVHYARHSTVILRYVYNGISDTYMGLHIECFIETLRGLLNAFPNFLQVVDLEAEKELESLGFEKVPPTKLEQDLYSK